METHHDAHAQPEHLLQQQQQQQQHQYPIKSILKPPKAELPPPPLPPHWMEYRDPAGVIYYYHTQLHMSQYERPVITATAADADVADIPTIEKVLEEEEEESTDHENNDVIKEKDRFGGMKGSPRGTNSNKVSVVRRSTATTIATGQSTASILSDDASFNTTNSNSHSTGGVHFSHVRIHEHRMTLGDNPFVSRGVPITLGWEVEKSETLGLDEYTHRKAEKERMSGGHKPRLGPTDAHARRMGPTEREAIALEKHTRDSLVRTHEEIQELKREWGKSLDGEIDDEDDDDNNDDGSNASNNSKRGRHINNNKNKGTRPKSLWRGNGSDSVSTRLLMLKLRQPQPNRVVIHHASNVPNKAHHNDGREHDEDSIDLGDDAKDTTKKTSKGFLGSLFRKLGHGS